MTASAPSLGTLTLISIRPLISILTLISILNANLNLNPNPTPQPQPGEHLFLEGSDDHPLFPEMTAMLAKMKGGAA